MSTSKTALSAARVALLSSCGVAALGVLAFSAQAEAADIYAPAASIPYPVAAPVALWSGFYAGAHVGGAWADLKTTDLDSYWFKDAENFNRFLRDTDSKRNGFITTNPFLFGPLHTDQSPSGVFGGGTIGYNVQRGALVFGIEADFGAMGLNRSQLLSNAPVNFQNRDGKYPERVPFNNIPLVYTETASANISTGFYGDLTGRIGWAWGPWMLYGKGGLAVLEAKTDVTDITYSFTTKGHDGHNTTNTYYGLGAADNNSRVGWTAGAGFEYLWNSAWSVKVEYQFFDFGTTSSSLVQANVRTFDSAPPEIKRSDTFSFNHDLTINTVKVGLNYHIGCCESVLPPLK